MKPRSDGTTLIALYHFISALLSLMGLCAVFSLPVIVGLSAGRDPDGQTATAILGVFAFLLGCLFLLIASANIVVGYGLWRRREWARIGAIGLAILRLINIPLGTVIGGLIIWYLLQDHVKEEFTG